MPPKPVKTQHVNQRAEEFENHLMDFTIHEDRATLFAAAEALTAGDRMDDYGSPDASFDRIASFWSAYLGAEITAHQVATMMTLLKISRSVTSGKRDTYVDMAAYVKLAHELREG